jgi:hypothetical protein
MIIYANGKVLGTDTAGDTQPITAQGPEVDELKVSDMETRTHLNNIIKELKILNLHMAILNDTNISRSDVKG